MRITWLLVWQLKSGALTAAQERHRVSWLSVRGFDVKHGGGRVSIGIR